MKIQTLDIRGYVKSYLLQVTYIYIYSLSRIVRFSALSYDPQHYCKAHSRSLAVNMSQTTHRVWRSEERAIVQKVPDLSVFGEARPLQAKGHSEAESKSP